MLKFYEPNEKNGFLSNFYLVDILFDGKIWASAESLYHSFKFTDQHIISEIVEIKDPTEVFNFSRKNIRFVRDDWEKVRLRSMYLAVANKFFQNNILRERLILTDERISEGSRCDFFWGLGSDNTGKNFLGRLLYVLRKKLQRLQLNYHSMATCFLPIDDKYHLFVSFSDGSNEHFILSTGQSRNQSSLLCRIHSECATGDLLGSQKCDCGGQLDEALNMIKASSFGALAYLRQEGRGIGLVNKTKTYEHQWYGQNTIEANLSIGRKNDEREYHSISPFLEFLKPEGMQLITNNPEKIDFIKQTLSLVPKQKKTSPSLNKHNRSYLAVKSKEMNHEFASSLTLRFDDNDL